ncbi:hypothetical protein ACFQRL_10555 [Microbacterium fluvii]|uniref:DUF559 domain-containing protein n=1 Tax=Microbacterium fluvii TaxID=415215 RepID=A0ABW2HHB3_9MICO|nr:hypothetical protein [Microbacterium fluvii]MCU4673035.1 hypothetical protein [Microbacterium fluvii]
MPKPKPLPPTLQGRAFTTGEAAAHGVSKSRLRRSDLSTPVRGHHEPRTEPAPVDPDEQPWQKARRELLARARAEHLRLPTGAALSHLTAAAVHGFPLSMKRLASGTIHITTTSDAARRRHRGVKVHPLPRDERRVVVDDMWLTHPLDTWCALASMLPLDELVELGDHLVRRQEPDATLTQLREGVRRYGGRRGAKKLRAALELVRERTDSVRETRLRLALLRAGLPEPAVNIVVRDGDGRRIKLGDLVYAEAKVLVEYDGEQHRTDSDQYAKDARDLERAAEAGWLVIRVRKGDRDNRAIAARVRRALRSRGVPT